MTKAGKDISVILNFYQDHIPKSLQINKSLEILAKKYPHIKFLKTISTKCVEKFPDSNLPYMLYYRNGELVQTVSAILLGLYSKLTDYAIEHLLDKVKVEGIKLKKKSKTQAKDFYHKKLDKNQSGDRDIDSDGEEREDKQFISNKIYIQY